MQTAVNPETGETAVLVGQKWQKAERIVTNEKGEKAYLVGGQWLTPSGPSELPGDPPVTAAGVMAESGKGLLRGASNTAMLIPEALSKVGGLAGALAMQGVRALAQPGREMVKADPQNEVERFAGTGSEIVGGSVAGGGANTVRNAVVTGISALTGATGEQLGGEAGKVGGAVLPAIVDFALTAGRNIPKNIVARKVQQTQSTPYAERGKEIAQKTGVDLSLGQQTGDEATMLVEGMARKNPFSSAEFQEFGGKQVGQAVERLQKIMDDITPEKIGDIRVGTMVNQAFDDAVTGAANVRRAQAAKDFGAVEAAGANAKVIGTSNLVSKLDDLISRYDVPGGGDATASLVSRMKGLREQLSAKATGKALVDPSGRALTSPSPSLSANETNRLLEVYTKASQGKGQIFADLETAQQRMLASELKGALLTDLDEAANTSQGAVAPLLKAARDNYKANSSAISKLEESVLGKYLGSDRSPERVADFLGRAKPTELKQTLDIVNKADPEVIPATRRYFIERAIEKAAHAPSQRNPKAPNFSAAKFIDAMPEGTKFDVLYGSSNAREELKLVGEALERIAYRGFTEGSPTAPLLMAWDAAKRLFTIQGIAGLPAAVIAPRTVAKAVLTPEGRQALVSLGRYDKPTESAIRSAAYLAGLAAADENNLRDPNAYWASQGGQKIMALPTVAGQIKPQQTTLATRWVLNQAGAAEQGFVNPDALARALEKTAPQLRASVMGELIRQRRVPPAPETADRK
jgi:hypothetical protein